MWERIAITMKKFKRTPKYAPEHIRHDYVTRIQTYRHVPNQESDVHFLDLLKAGRTNMLVAERDDVLVLAAECAGVGILS